MKKRIVFTGFLMLTAFLILGLTNWCYAGANWKEEQASMFKEIPVKPGDVITSSNWEKVKDIMPPSMVEWVKKGDLIVKIGEMEYDLEPDAEWLAASAKNQGKYSLNETKEIIDISTKKLPNYIYGDPFPGEIDIKNDPDAGIKIEHNISIQRTRSGQYTGDFDIDWVNRGGVERSLFAMCQQFYFYSRPGGEAPNPDGMYSFELDTIFLPKDLEGMLTLDKRYIATKADDYIAYVPAIRRAKKMSGANRSDPFAGSDFVNDDTYGWDGKNTSMKWKILDRKIVLVAMQENQAKRRIPGTKQPDGSWLLNTKGFNVQAGFEVSGSKGVPWLPVNVVWVPRIVTVIEGVPIDRYYNYGRQILYVDHKARTGLYKIVYDKALTYWKTLLTVPNPAEWGEPKKETISNSNWYVIVDDKASHACTAHYVCNRFGREYRNVYNDQSVKLSDFSESIMGTKSR